MYGLYRNYIDVRVATAVATAIENDMDTGVVKITGLLQL